MFRTRQSVGARLSQPNPLLLPPVAAAIFFQFGETTSFPVRRAVEEIAARAQSASISTTATAARSAISVPPLSAWGRYPTRSRNNLNEKGSTGALLFLRVDDGTVETKTNRVNATALPRGTPREVACSVHQKSQSRSDTTTRQHERPYSSSKSAGVSKQAEHLRRASVPRFPDRETVLTCVTSTTNTSRAVSVTLSSERGVESTPNFRRNILK